MADIDGILAAAAVGNPTPVQPSASDLDLTTFMPAAVTAPTPQVSVVEQRRAAVATAAEDKRVALGGPPSAAVFRNAAITRLTGAGRETASGIERDLATLTYDEIFQKYGDQAPGLILGLTAAQGSFSQLAANGRSGSESVTDSAKGVGIGLANSVLGIGALGAGLVSDQAGLWAAGKVEDLNQWAQGTQSAGLRARRQANQEVSALERRDTTAQYEKDRETDGELVASLKRMGREGVNAVAGVVQDPALLSDGVAQGVGSILAAGPVTKVLSKVGQATLGVKLSQTAATSLGIGAMESAGTYTDTVSGLKDLKHEQLLERSPTYKSLIDQGWSQEEARNRVINRAALLGAAATAPAAVAAGRLVAGFESAPFRVGSLGSAAGNLVREGVEEGIQGGTSQLAQNLAVQAVADNTRTASEGVGEQIGLGALYGVGAAGALQAPGVARRAAVAGAVSAGNAIASAVNGRVDRLREANEASSPVSEQNLQQRTAEAVVNAPAAKEALTQTIEALPVAPEVKAQTNEAVDRLLQAGTFPTEWLTEPSIPEGIRNRLQGSQTTVDAMRGLAQTILDPKNPNIEEKLVAAQMLLGMRNFFDEAVNADLSALDELPEDHSARKLVDSYRTLWGKLSQSKVLASAFELATEQFAKAADEGKIPDIKPEELQGDQPLSPEAQQKVDLNVTSALLNPEKAKPETVDLILQHATSGKLKMSVPQFQALQAVQSILMASKRALDEQASLGHIKPLNSISSEIMVGTRADGGRGSALEYAKGVFQAMQGGNQAEAQAQLRNLQMLAQNQINKIQGINQGFLTGQTEARKFEATSLKKDGSTFTSYAPDVNPASPESIELVQRVLLEAQRLVDVYNGMVKAFPFLGGQELSAPSLVPELKGRPAKVAAEFAAGTRVRPGANKPPVQSTNQNQASQPDLLGGEELSVDEMEAIEARKDRAVDFDNYTGIIAPKVIDGFVDEDTGESYKHWYAEDTIDDALADFMERTPDERKDILADMAMEYTSNPKALGDRASQQRYLELIQRFRKIVANPPAATPRGSAPGDSQGQSETGAAVTGTAALFPDLVEGNRFTDSHKLPEEPRTRLVGQDEPLRDIWEAFSTSGSLTRFTEGKFGPDIPRKLLAKTQDWLAQGGDILTGLNERLYAFLTNDKNAKGKTVASPLERMLAGENVFGWANGKPLNIVEKTKDGYAYNEALIHTAVLAALQWRLTLTDSVQTLDEEDVAEIVGLKNREGEVPGRLMSDMLGGFSAERLKRSLTSKIQEYWGFSENRDAPMGYTIGVAEAIAAELLEVMLPMKSQLGLSVTSVQGHPDAPATLKWDSGFNIYRIDSTVEPDPELNQIKFFVDKAILTKPEPIYYFGDDRPKVPDTQHRNPAVALTDEQKAAIENANNVRYSFDTNMLNFMELVGSKTWLEIFGADDLTDKPLNEQHRLSLEGQNRSILDAYNALFSLRDQAQQEYGDLDQAEIHYSHTINRTGRLQNLAPFNPQSSKDIREAVVSTWSTLDLSNQNGTDYQKFMLSLAQALGISVHKKPMESTLKELQKKLDAFAPTLSHLDSFLNLNRLPENFAQIVKADTNKAGGALSRAGLRALLEYARFSNMDAAEKSSFRTSLYVEADGLTNGPINAMRLLAIGQVTPQWITGMLKGGLSFTGSNGGPKTTNEAYGKFGVTDLYTTATEYLKTGLEHIKTLLTSNGTQLQHKHLNELIREFMPDVRLDDQGNLVFDRGVAKNPLTITIYGSGEQGLTGKVADLMLEKIYERMSLAAQRTKDNPGLSMGEAMFGGPGIDPKAAQQKFARFEQALNGLTTWVAKTNLKGEMYVTKGEDVQNLSWNFLTFALEGNHRKNFLQNLRTLYVSPLSDAIRQTVGAPTMMAAELIKNATQAQSIFQQEAFNALVRAEIEKRRETNPQIRSEGLSRNELQKILEKVLKLYPPITTGTQTFFPAGSQTTDVDNTEYSQSLTRGFKSAGQVYGPANSGVAGIPYMVIGTGDGYMIQRLASAKDAPTNALYIYDGIHFDLNTLEENSVKANRAVYDSWQGNPLQAVFNAYSKSMPSFDLNKLSDEALISLGRVFRLKPDEVSVQTLETFLTSLGQSLEASAMSVTALNRAMAKVNHHIDQMASAQSPYEHKGLVLSGSTPEEIAAQLEKLRMQELVKLEKERGKDAGFVNNVLAILNPSFVSTVQLDEQAEGQGGQPKVEIYRPESLSGLITNFKLSPVAREFYNQIQLQDALAGYTVLRGTAQELLSYARENGLTPPSLTETGKQINGAIHVGEKRIYWVKGNESVEGEALAHEIVHAATVETVYGVLSGKITDPKLVQAVSNLQTLMDQFLAIDPSMSDAATQQAYTNAVNAIRAWQVNPNQNAIVRQTGALNEFMAWTLANQDLNKLLAGTKSKDLVQLVKDAMAAIKAFLFGNPKAKPANDILSQLLFNSSVLLYGQVDLGQEMRATAMQMSMATGTSDRLSELTTFFNDRVTDFITTDRTDYSKSPMGGIADRWLRERQAEKGQANADALEARAVAAGLLSTSQAQTAFKAVVAALATQAKIDPNSLTAAQSLYAHVLSKLTPTSFRLNEDPSDQNDAAQSLAKYDFVVGKDLVTTDLEGRSSLLPVFLALGLVDDRFREVMATIEVPKTVKKDNTGIDARLQNAGMSLMDMLSENLSGTSKSITTTQAIDALTARLQKVAQESRSVFERGIGTTGNVVDQINTKTLQGIDGLVQATLRTADKIENTNPNSKGRKILAAALRTSTALANEQQAEAVAKGITAAINNIDGWNPLKDLITDLIGRTKDNAGVYDLIKQTRTEAQQDRQRYREDVPSVISKKFSRKLTDAEWTSLFRGIGKTDLAVLLANRSRSEVLDLLENPNQVQKLISKLETSIQQQDTAHWAAVQRKAKQLATFMNTGVFGTNLLRNATAVAKLYGENPNRRRVPPSDAYISEVDQLITLYALQGLSQGDLDAMASLVQSEKDGMDFVLAYLNGQRQEEMDRAFWGRARDNHYKGHVPSLQETGVSLIVANDLDIADLKERSYVRVGDYTGSPAEGVRGSFGYYFAPVSAKAPFNQGIFQNVRQTASGVEADSGFTTGLTAGRITEPVVVAMISKRLAREGNRTTENLLPIYENGQVVAYERGIDPNQLTKLNQDTHLARMIGVWRGRQVEEAKSHFFNQRLIDALKQMYQRDVKLKPSNQSQYVNLMSPEAYSDPVVADALDLLPKESWAYARAAFQADELWVRKDLLKDVVGERKATISDAWSGNTRWSPQVQKGVKTLALAFMGNDAYRYLMNTEQEIQALVKSARQLIVVKSMIVPAANFISNIYHMISRGVPLATITRQVPKKLAEIHEYTRSRVQEVELEAQLRAAADKPLEATKLQARIKSIQDSYRRMSIWPLIEAGEFSSISDAGISRDELLMTGGKLHAFIEKQASKLPEAVQRAGKYAFITKDTALFQGLQLAVQYGDFIAKAVMYDDMTQRKKMTKEASLGVITEEFVNYDKLPGRFRGYIEDMGLLWFYNFKIRSVKIALSVIRNNPVHALIMGLLPTPPLTSIGTPLADNLFIKGIGGSLPYSMGPGMGLSAPMLNPWANLVH